MVSRLLLQILWDLFGRSLLGNGAFNSSLLLPHMVFKGSLSNNLGLVAELHLHQSSDLRKSSASAAKSAPKWVQTYCRRSPVWRIQMWGRGSSKAWAKAQEEKCLRAPVLPRVYSRRGSDNVIKQTQITIDKNIDG